MNNLNSFFVFGCDSNGYGVIRSLAEANLGMEIYGVDFNINSPGLYSRYLKNKFVISDPNKSIGNAFQDVFEIGKKFKIKPVAIITSDIFLILFNEYREKLAEIYLFNIPPKELLETILDKGKQYKLIAKIGNDLPKTVFYSITSEDEIKEEFNYPVFIKGASPYLWKQHFIEKGFIAKNENELLNKLNELRNVKLDLIIQEIIMGPNSNHFKVSAYYDRNGDAKLFFTTQKMRQFPYDFGVGTYMVSKRVDELLEKGKFYFDSLKYKGIGSIEFKIDERDGKFKFIELNPRMWQQNYQATVAGLNFAKIYYLDCLEKKITFSDKFKENITYIDTVNDFQSFVKNKLVNKQSFWDWIKQVLFAHSYAFWKIDDPVPILKSSHYGLKLFKYLLKTLKILIS